MSGLELRIIRKYEPKPFDDYLFGLMLLGPWITPPQDGNNSDNGSTEHIQPGTDTNPRD